jgi:hypothetical protein
MGGTSSKTLTEQLTEIAVNISSKTISECQASVSNNISIKNVGTIWINGGIKQTADLDLTCLQSSNKVNQLTQRLTTEITNLAETKGVAVLSAIGTTKSEAEVRIQQKLQTEINMDSIARLASSIQNNIEFTHVNTAVVNGPIEQSTSLVGKFVMDAIQSSGIQQDLESAIQNSSKSVSESPWAFLTDFLSNPAVLIVVGLVALAALGIFLGFNPLSIVKKLATSAFSKSEN